MATTPVLGHQSIAAFDTALPFDALSTRIILLSETLTQQQELLPDDGLRGTRQMSVEGTRTGKSKYSGQIVLACRPLALDALLPAIQGAAEVIDVFSPAETLPKMFLQIDKVSQVHTYNNCVFGKAEFKLTAGSVVIVTIDVEAETETIGAAGTAVSLATLALPTDKPYVWADGVLTIGGTAYKWFEASITIDNMLDADRFVNELTRSEIPSNGRSVDVSLNVPATTTNIVLAQTALAGSASTLVCTSGDVGTSILTFTLATLQMPKTSANVQGKGEIKLPLTGKALKSGATSDLVITNAHA